MNLYFRLFLLVFKIIFSKSITPLQRSVLFLRVWPTDLDFQMHMTNSRYLSLMDLGRTYWLGQIGLIKHIHKRKWLPVVNTIAMTYIRPLQPFQTFRLETRVITWEDKYFYLEQRFLDQDHLYAVGLVRAAFLEKHKVLPAQAVVSLVSGTLVAPEMPPMIQDWKQLLQSKKAASTLLQ